MNLKELKLVNDMMTRCRAVVQEASKLGVRLMIDAEQTYFQVAIDNVVFNLQRCVGVCLTPHVRAAHHHV